MEERITQGLTVSRAESGQKLLSFLLRRIDAAAGDLHRWIRTGQIRLNGKRAKPFDRVKEGNIVRVPPFAAFLPAADGAPPPCPPPSSLNIVYEDEDILVINKPAGLPVQGGMGYRDSVAARLAHERAGSPFVPAPVHRLDKDTTGLLAAGKTYAAVRLISDALAGRKGVPPRKEYLAWAEGHWPAKKPQELVHFVCKQKETGRMKISASPGEGAVEARCLVLPQCSRCIDGRKYTLLLVRLFTGRKHQIRLQLAACGHAVAGDALYGAENPSVPGLMLHAFRLELPLPKGRKILTCLPSWTPPWDVAPLFREA